MPLIIPGNRQASTGFTINQSIRFNDDDSPILKKTYSSAGTEETFTLSMWVKRGNIGAGLGASNLGLTLFSGGASVSDYGEIVFRSSGYGVQDSLHFYNSASGSINFELVTTQLFRDPSAWYHLVFVMDTTNAVASERMRIYVNGSRVTDFSTETYPSKDAVPNFNTATEHGIGGFAVSTDTRFFDGYLAEIVFLDGTATDCNSFAEFNSSGIWVPKSVSGLTFGTNGFHIDGRDSADLGDDESGQGNDYTASGLASHDQMVGESPTNNFAVLSPINIYGSNVALAEGNLQSSVSSSSNNRGAKATQGATSGKWYFEVYFSSSSSDNNGGVGVSGNSEYNGVPGETSDSEGFRYMDAGNFRQNGSSSSVITTISAGDVVMVAFDIDNNKAWFGKNGTFFSSGDPANGNNPLTTTVPDLALPASYHYSTPATQIFNFGQEGTFAGNITAGGNSDGNGIGNFKYSVPSGYLAICTKNLGS